MLCTSQISARLLLLSMCAEVSDDFCMGGGVKWPLKVAGAGGVDGEATRG